MKLPNCPAIARIVPTINSEDFQLYGRVIHESGGEKNALVCLKHTHAHTGIVRDLSTDPEYARVFQQHQNAIRMMAHLLFIEGQPSRVFVEGFMTDEGAPRDLLDIVYDFERLHGKKTMALDGRISVPFLNVSGKGITTPDGLDEDDMKVVRMRIRSLCGKQRQSAYCVMNGQAHRLHGIETRESEQRTHELYEEMTAPFGMLYPNFDKIFREINALRHASVVTQVRSHLADDEVGILILGTGHFQDEKGEVSDRQVAEPLEKTFAREAPETRLLVVESHVVPPPKGSLG